MKSLRDIRTQEAADEFSRLVAFILKNDGKLSRAAMRAESGKLESVRGLTPRLLNILKSTGGDIQISRDALMRTKAAVPSIGITGSPFQDFSAVSSGFAISLQSFGVYDRLLPDMAQVPVAGSTVGAVTISANGYSVGEGLLKPMSKV